MSGTLPSPLCTLWLAGYVFACTVFPPSSSGRRDSSSNEDADFGMADVEFDHSFFHTAT
mgnify:CR=1 FL=1